MRHLIDITDFSREELDGLLRLGLDMAAQGGPGRRLRPGRAEGALLASLFFEPSTRTRLSFESAMLSLGGRVLGFSDAGTSSVTKGETLPDTIRMAAGYADMIVMRHPLEGAAMMAALYSKVPVVNAGDGGHAHPTQTLTDLLTLLREKGGIDGLTVGLCGDLKYGRTVHSLIRALGLYRDIRLVLISPPELALPGYMRPMMDAAHMARRETASLEDALPGLDVLYMTRIQRERFDDPSQYARLKGSYVLDKPKLGLARGDAVVLHPLPRVDEIAAEVDDDPRAAYFRQAENGRYVRMALLDTLLRGALPPRPLYDPLAAQSGGACQNPRCITAHTPGARQIFVPAGDGLKCLYCEHEFIL